MQLPQLDFLFKVERGVGENYLGKLLTSSRVHGSRPLVSGTLTFVLSTGVQFQRVMMHMVLC